MQSTGRKYMYVVKYIGHSIYITYSLHMKYIALEMLDDSQQQSVQRD